MTDQPDINDAIDAWHNGAAPDQSLAQHLDLTDEQYRLWAQHGFLPAGSPWRDTDDPASIRRTPYNLGPALDAVLDHTWGDTALGIHATHRRHKHNSSCAACTGDIPAILAVAAEALATAIRAQVCAEDGHRRYVTAYESLHWHYACGRCGSTWTEPCPPEIPTKITLGEWAGPQTPTGGTPR